MLFQMMLNMSISYNNIYQILVCFALRFPASVAVSTATEDDNVPNALQATLDIQIAKVN